MYIVFLENLVRLISLQRADGAVLFPVEDRYITRPADSG